MSFLISPALADTASQSQAGFITGFLPLILIIVVFYFLLIRPQQKRQKSHREMLANMQKGDEVVVASGVYGKVIEMGQSHVVVSVYDNTALTVQKSAVTQILPKGTIDKLD